MARRDMATICLRSPRRIDRQGSRMFALDHITVAALSLEDGVAFASATLGVSIPPGGAHVQMATHNHLLRLGDTLFLEVIAPDPSASVARPRWFALDDARMRA